ncbi:MAG: CoA pyrophosphatase [Gammaproteobacteria bacterium]|nr:CoA pyrophosphatase [Gammaproteobacteria bacterium]
MLDFIQRLRDQLTRQLPGEDAQFQMAPMKRLRMREALAAAPEVRQSAVLLYFFPKRDDWYIVLMKRPDYDGTHSGQVGIPGGRLEAGESHLQAALREFEEEIGIAVDGSNLLGKLSDLFIPPSNYLVQPYVAYSLESPYYVPDPVEVEEVIELSATWLLNRSAIKRGKVRLNSGVVIESPYFEVAGHTVWGATAMILSELKQILRAVG